MTIAFFFKNTLVKRRFKYKNVYIPSIHYSIFLTIVLCKTFLFLMGVKLDFCHIKYQKNYKFKDVNYTYRVFDAIVQKKNTNAFLY